MTPDNTPLKKPFGHAGAASGPAFISHRRMKRPDNSRPFILSIARAVPLLRQHIETEQNGTRLAHQTLIGELDHALARIGCITSQTIHGHPSCESLPISPIPSELEEMRLAAARCIPIFDIYRRALMRQNEGAVPADINTIYNGLRAAIQILRPAIDPIGKDFEGPLV